MLPMPTHIENDAPGIFLVKHVSAAVKALNAFPVEPGAPVLSYHATNPNGRPSDWSFIEVRASDGSFLSLWPCE